MTTCHHLNDGRCEAASELAGLPIIPERAACADCVRQSPPQDYNRVTVGMALAHRANAGLDNEDLLKEFGRVIFAHPPVTLRAVSYAAAVARWVAKGFKVRQFAEVKRIYRDICGPCEYRIPSVQPAVSYCGKGCHCRLSDHPSVSNKIFMATESCEAGKW